MNEQKSNAVIATATTSWTTIPGRDVAAPCLEVTFRRRPDDADTYRFVEEIRIEPPRSWKPGTVFIGRNARALSELKAGSAVLNDSRAATWEVSQRITRDTWAIILSNMKPESALPSDFALDVAVLLENAGAPSENMVVSVDETRETLAFTVPLVPAGPKWIVHLESDPDQTNALVRGQELVLRWKVQNIEGDAELRGSLPGANTIRIANGDSGQRTVRALGESVYSLTALVAQDGQLVEIVRRVHMNLAVPQFGLNLEFVPAAVFPGGPVVCYRSAYNVKKVQFTRSGDEPSLAAHNYIGKETTILDSFIVPRGPAEGRAWLLGAVYTSPQGEESAQGNLITGAAPAKFKNSMFLNLPCAFGTNEGARVHALAAGAFIVTSEGPYPQIAKREWIALATTASLDLWARDPAVGEVKAAADVQGGKWKNNWLDDALTGEFLGVGAANEVTGDPDMQGIVAIRKTSGEEGIAEVIEIEFPLREDNPHRRVLSISDKRFVRAPVRVIPIGSRVFLLGNGAAISYERNVQLTSYRDEPHLAIVAFPEWEVVGLTPIGSSNATGHLFALEKKSGVLLRFDVQDGIVTPPRAAAQGNDKIARLDELQQAQACLSKTPPPFPREALEDARGYTGKNTDGSILEYLNPIDENSAMVALGSVLLVRSEVVDPSIGQTIQDRVYDPRLDVWARCGHPFTNATRSTVNFFASTQSTLYGLADDELQYLEGSLSAYLGFMGSDYTPIDRQSLASAPWPETFTFPEIVNDTPLELSWRDGRLSANLLEGGQLRLALISEERTVITVDAQINRETGDIQGAKAINDTTGREVALCRWSARSLTITPMIWSLQIHAQPGLVLPFAYVISDGYSPPITGETSTGNTLDIPSITGETRCTLAFEYDPGQAKSGALDARAKLIIANGIVADFQWEGKHAPLFQVDIDEGRIIRLSLDKGAR